MYAYVYTHTHEFLVEEGKKEKVWSQVMLLIKCSVMYEGMNTNTQLYVRVSKRFLRYVSVIARPYKRPNINLFNYLATRHQWQSYFTESQNIDYMWYAGLEHTEEIISWF
jgi:hypothetical protein